MTDNQFSSQIGNRQSSIANSSPLFQIRNPKSKPRKCPSEAAQIRNSSSRPVTRLLRLPECRQPAEPQLAQRPVRQPNPPDPLHLPERRKIPTCHQEHALIRGPETLFLFIEPIISSVNRAFEALHMHRLQLCMN